MRTDGLNAFDPETRVLIERLLRLERPPSPRQPSRVLEIAAALAEFRAQGGQTTAKAWAQKHGIHHTALYSAISRQNPEIRARAVASKRRRRST